MAVENAKKANMPVDWLSRQFKELDASDKATAFRSPQANTTPNQATTNSGQRRVDDTRQSLSRRRDSRENDTVHQKQEMRRQSKMEYRKRRSIERDTEQVAESSVTGARRKQASTLKSFIQGGSPPSQSSPSDSSSPSSPSMQAPDYRPLPLPAWYWKIKPTDFGMKQLAKRPTPEDTQALKALQSMKGCIERCEKGGNKAQLAKLFEELRDHVHKAEILLKVDRNIVRKAKILEEETGLPRIFATTVHKVNYPWDLKADSYQLYSRWREEIFEVDLLRGIKARKGVDRNADSIDPSWKGRFSAKYYGEGSLVPGQWWPTQLTTVRDGAHGSPQGGIFGEKEMGAYSVVLSGGGAAYDDQDDGNEIWYSGTDGKDFTMTENTMRLMESCDVLHNKIRVFRSHQLRKNNPYRPVVGLRYDGLYEAVEKRLVDREKQIYKFRLVRCPGQFPIRCENNAARRPTRFEIDEDMRLRKNGR